MLRSDRGDKKERSTWTATAAVGLGRVHRLTEVGREIFRVSVNARFVPAALPRAAGRWRRRTACRSSGTASPGARRSGSDSRQSRAITASAGGSRRPGEPRPISPSSQGQGDTRQEQMGAAGARSRDRDVAPLVRLPRPVYGPIIPAIACPTRSAACSMSRSPRWAYLSVMRTLEWPSRWATTGMGMPFIAAWLACVWRRS